MSVGLCPIHKGVFQMKKNMRIIRLICAFSALSLLLCACGNVGNGSAGDNGRSNSSTENTQTAQPEPVSDDIVAPTQEPVSKETSLVIKGESDPTTDTLTKLRPLEKVTYEVKDPNNSVGLSTKKCSHSHGPASGGKPHQTVVEFQKKFDKYSALTLDTKSDGKVLYLTFDCGYEYNNLSSKILDILKEKGVPAAFFCTLHHIKDQPELIARMINEGHIVGNHSTNHPSFAEINRTKMVREIEECENYLRENFGYAAKFFRFPAGEYNDSALDEINSMGYKSIFWSVAYADWDVKSPKGKDYAVKTVMARLHPGAVILLHSVSQDNADALGEIIDKARSEGYEFKALDEYNFS